VAGRPFNTPDFFWALIDRSNLYGCWNWTASRNWQGYGQFTYEGTKWRAHRLAYLLTFPDWDRTAPLLHTCDNPGCCNPAHLKPGSIAENNADTRQRGRDAHGARNGQAKLTDEKVIVILASSEKADVLARRFGVDVTTVRNVRRGTYWKHIPRKD